MSKVKVPEKLYSFNITYPNTRIEARKKLNRYKNKNDVWFQMTDSVWCHYTKSKGFQFYEDKPKSPKAQGFSYGVSHY